MEMKISIDEAVILEEARKLAERNAQKSANYQVEVYFQQAVKHLGRPEGVGMTIVQNMIEEELLNADFEKRVRQRVRDQMDKQADQAVDAMLQHTARRGAFLERDSAIIRRLEQILEKAEESDKSKIEETLAYLKSKINN